MNNMSNKKITIVGLGLIGGSLAKALYEKAGIRNILAVDRNRDYINKALKDGIIREGYDSFDQNIWNSDIIFVCTPVKQAIDHIGKIAENVGPDTIVTDVGSTKGEILEYVNSLKSPPCFIGGHPMAGSEKAGYFASSSHLFENAYYILCPSRTCSTRALELMKSITESIGALPLVLDHKQHDQIAGCVSHVPHVVAAALVNLVKTMEHGSNYMQMLAAGGFKDITRIASSNPEIWENITLSNKEQIKSILDVYVNLIKEFERFIENSDSQSIYKFFESAKLYRDTFPTGKVGLITPVFEILVDVEDKPGIIGEVATILGSKGINIKNINVSNSREFEQGCLRITLPDEASANMAVSLLSEKGYRTVRI